VTSWTAGPEDAGERLDRHVAARLDAPRNQVQRWIRDGHVRVGGREEKPSYSVVDGDRIDCDPPEPKDDRVAPEEGDLRILYEDADLVALDKPAGLTVHPGAGRPTGTLAHHLLARYPEMAGVGGVGRPGIVHRLDQGTSGVLVVARTAAAYHRLARAFAGREVDKRYLAIVYGEPKPPAGLIDAPIGRHAVRRKEMAVRADGRPSRTGYRTLAAQAGISLVELHLETGRTHQIRVHLSALHHPCVGDPLYGSDPNLAAKLGLERQWLHAVHLGFDHPRTGERVDFESPYPDDLQHALDVIRHLD
jgi:23S rRNA pseudouridine1911/1915/1917 synthase